MISAVGFHQRCGVGVAKRVWFVVRTMRTLGGPVLLTMVATMVAPPVAMTQRTDEEAAIVATEMGPSTALVTLEGKGLFRVRGVSAYPAEQRAHAIAERIEGHCQLNGSQPNMTTTYCGHDFFEYPILYYFTFS
jgi:hypothetical protein